MRVTMDDPTRQVDAALAAGLRAIPATEFVDAREHAIEARLLYLCWGALRIGAQLVPVYVAPALRVRVAGILAAAEGDALLERAAQWLRTGVVFHA